MAQHIRGGVSVPHAVHVEIASSFFYTDLLLMQRLLIVLFQTAGVSSQVNPVLSQTFRYFIYMYCIYVGTFHVR